ncbi:(2Fe-2S) ferredoxin domain-containing protein [Sphingomonas sp.]|uniref:(2Fe-2S) ferredoxin domain-containing protein n=1 Tax=Sphingomonas sp. TaxID=28214 RepID=UPI0035BBF7DD
MKDHVRSDWSGAILVCGKCSKKAGGKSLAKALRRELGAGKGRRAALGVVETKCLGVCPKRGIVVIDTAAPGRWHIVPADATAADLAERLERTVSPPRSP